VGSAQFTTILACVFDSNGNGSGCAGVCGIGPGLIENCVFIGNQALGSGGAILGGSLEVKGCLFDSNEITGTAAAMWLGGTSNLVEGNTIVNSMQSVSSNDGSAIVVTMLAGSYVTTLRNNVIALSSGSPAIDLRNGKIASDCNVFWMNADGISDSSYVLSPTDRVVDPRFCNAAGSDWTLELGSPCLPADPAGCGQIGAFGQGCGAVSVEPTSWGKVKGFYREGAE
jgi:predicted outer membrane repeat protein